MITESRGQLVVSYHLLIHHLFWTGIAFLMLSIYPQISSAVHVAYTDQTAFLSALTGMGLTYFHEGFEDDSVWGSVRSPNTGTSMVSSGITWTSNNLSSGLTTSSGAARNGNWGLYSSPHGSFTDPDPGANCFNPGECGDGLRGEAVSGMMYGVGGWFVTNTPFAKLGMYIGDHPNNPVDFGETCDEEGENCYSNAIIGTTPKFFGVVDMDGFTEFEYSELEGKLEVDGGDIKFIFSDDFYSAGSIRFNDYDGDGLTDTVDNDDDNDGLLDSEEENVGSNPLNADTDNDGIRDGIDPSPGVIYNDNNCDLVGPESVNFLISGDIVRCASQSGVTVQGSTQITNSGELLIITPYTSINPGFSMAIGSKLKVYSEDLPFVFP